MLTQPILVQTTMFKRLNRARALRDELEDQVDESEPVTLEAALDEDSASDSDVESDSDEDDDEDDDDEGSEDDVDEDKFTVKQALESPVFLDDEANVRANIFRCVACPLAQLRSEKAIEVHLDSKVGHETDAGAQATIYPFCSICRGGKRARR